MTSDVMNLAAGAGGLVLGVLGVLLTIGYARQAKRSQARLRRLTWADFQLGAHTLTKQISRRRGIPDAIVALSPRGAVVGHLLLVEFGRRDIPMYVALNFLNDSVRSPFPEIPEGDWIVAETNRSRALLPRSILTALVAKRLLLVDDWVLSGDMMYAVREALISGGLQDLRITTCAMATTEGAIRNGKAPGYFVWTVDADGTYFPWGPAR